MARNPKRRTVRVGYGLFRSIRQSEQRWAPLAEINDRLRTLGDVPLSRRSYQHWRRYVEEGITMETYPGLNRWEIARSATPVEFLDAS